MKATRMKAPIAAAIAITISGAAAWAQGAAAPPSTKAITNENRLFQRFIEDGAVTEGGWVEGQFRFQSYDNGDAFMVGPVVAFNLAEDIELGGRLNLLSVNPDPGDTETGLSDMDLYAKVRLTMKPTQVALGVLLKLPTGDKEQFLGTGEADVAFFAGLRHDFESMTLVGNAGLRINQDPDWGTGGTGPDGEISIQLGGGLLFPITARLVGVFEATFETERIDGIGSDFRLTFGGDYGISKSFKVRGALAGGMGDGAPNLEVIASAVFLF